MPATPDANPSQEFDTPWKDVIEFWFRGFCRRFLLRAAYRSIDWSVAPVFLNQELSEVVRDATFGPHHVDKLVRVRLLSGEEAYVLILVDVQMQRRADLMDRGYRYWYRTYDRYGLRIMGLIILGDPHPRWRPTEFRLEQWGSVVSYRPVVHKLLDYRGRERMFRRWRHPFALILLAHLESLATRQEPQQRRATKVALVRRLYGRGYSREETQEVLRFLDWVLALPEAEQQIVDQEVRQLEAAMAQPYVTTWERRGFARGREEGRQEGQQEGRQEGQQEGRRNAICELLGVRFPGVEEQARARLGGVRDLETLSLLLRSAYQAQAIEEFWAALDRAAASTPSG